MFYIIVVLTTIFATPAKALDGTPSPANVMPMFKAAPLDLPPDLMAQAPNQAAAVETLKWRHVQHAASIQTRQVGDVDGHTLSLYRLPGLASFADGSTGTTMVIGTNDSVNGSGPASGYLILTFNDGSFGRNTPGK